MKSSQYSGKKYNFKLRLTSFIMIWYFVKINIGYLQCQASSRWAKEFRSVELYHLIHCTMPNAHLHQIFQLSCMETQQMETMIIFISVFRGITDRCCDIPVNAHLAMSPVDCCTNNDNNGVIIYFRRQFQFVNWFFCWNFGMKNNWQRSTWCGTVANGVAGAFNCILRHTILCSSSLL